MSYNSELFQLYRILFHTSGIFFSFFKGGVSFWNAERLIFRMQLHNFSHF